MSDSLKSASNGRAYGFGGYLKGRSGRKEYWILIALLVVIAVAISLLPRHPSGSFGAVALMLLQIRRVHDLGRTGWWAAAAQVVPLLALPLFWLVSEEAAMLVGSLIMLALIIWIGALPGDKEANRFGPPPPSDLRRILTGQ